jgi:ABC-type transport system involved in cytochrome c biogenesis ATPase subunit
MTALAIDVHGLTKRFGRKVAVDHVDIAVPEGEVWGFLGPNGSGKTTTIRMLCGLLKPDAGTGKCLGYELLQEPENIKREVGYMTQRFSFWEDLSIRENLEFVARLYAVAERKQKVDATLARLGLTARQDQLVGNSASPLPPACCMSRVCCCSTSRPPVSIRRRAANSGRRFITSAKPALRCSSARITWTRPNAATGSSISTRAASSRAARSATSSNNPAS